MGDWKVKNGQLRQICVSDMGNEDYAFLVALHELVEGYLCVKRKISDEVVTDFDKEYEARRPEGDTSEPGNDLRAPYHKEHVFATYMERFMAEELKVDWRKYEEAIYAL